MFSKKCCFSEQNDKMLVRIEISEDMIRLLLKKQSDLVLHCLSMPYSLARCIHYSCIDVYMLDVENPCSNQEIHVLFEYGSELENT